MEKRYQVFVSSTFADLKDERQKVIQTLMEMDCIPAGMELFPAADEEQWNFIKRVIDDCDYYILIIGARYGSLSDTGISYTQMEYEYALESGLKVLAFVHNAPDDLPASKSDLDPDLRKKLDEFREHVKTNRLVKFWKEPNELLGLVALSLTKTIKMYPAVGWIRGDNASTTETLKELNQLRKENENLRKKIDNLEPENETPYDIAGINETFELRLEWSYAGYQITQHKEEKAVWTWSALFGALAPSLAEHPIDSKANSILAKAIYRKKNSTTSVPSSLKIHPDDFDTIRIQFESLGLVKLRYTKTTRGSMGLFWCLTPQGENLMVQLRTVRSSS